MFEDYLNLMIAIYRTNLKISISKIMLKINHFQDLGI